MQLILLHFSTLSRILWRFLWPNHQQAWLERMPPIRWYARVSRGPKMRQFQLEVIEWRLTTRNLTSFRQSIGIGRWLCISFRPKFGTTGQVDTSTRKLLGGEEALLSRSPKISLCYCCAWTFVLPKNTERHPKMVCWTERRVPTSPVSIKRISFRVGFSSLPPPSFRSLTL